MVTIADQTKTPELAGVCIAAWREVERFKDKVDVYRQKMTIIGQDPEPVKCSISISMVTPVFFFGPS